MILACVNNITFKLNKNKHTCAYAEVGKRVEEKASSKELMFNTIKAVIAPDRNTAVKMLRLSVQNYLDKWSWNVLQLEYQDFTFGISESDVEDSHLWLIPCLTDCRDYPVDGEVLPKAV